MILEYSRQIFSKQTDEQTDRQTEGRTDGHDEANSCSSQFCERA